VKVAKGMGALLVLALSWQTLRDHYNRIVTCLTKEATRREREEIHLGKQARQAVSAGPVKAQCCQHNIT